VWLKNNVKNDIVINVFKNAVLKISNVMFLMSDSDEMVDISENENNEKNIDDSTKNESFFSWSSEKSITSVSLEN